MRFCLIFLLSFLSAPDTNERGSLIEIRNLYAKSASSKASNGKLLRLLEGADKGSALMEGYRGAALMIEASHLLSPLSKWNRFKIGKGLIEHAVKAEPDNVETRYIRLTIQTNLPAFLGYSSHVKTDKNLIMAQLPKLDDKDLAARIRDYLLSADICSDQEIKKIQTWKNR
jgi:hypothetical protein